jgi:hypothetical protein
VRFIGSLLAIVTLATACGGTTVDTREDALTVAEAEIAELEERLAVTLDQLAGAVHQDSSAEGFPVLVSSGPCGVFRVSGTGLVKLRWTDDDSEEEAMLGPEDWHPRDVLEFWWEDTGIDFFSEFGDATAEDRELSLFEQRPPDTARAVKVHPERNDFFHLEWRGEKIDFTGTQLGAFGLFDPEELEGTMSMWAGFFGVDSNCEWGWVPISSQPDKGYSNMVQNSYLDGYYDWDSDSGGTYWFVQFRFKDYSCEERPPPDTPVQYDSNMHAFVGECPEPE